MLTCSQWSCLLAVSGWIARRSWFIIYKSLCTIRHYLSTIIYIHKIYSVYKNISSSVLTNNIPHQTLHLPQLPWQNVSLNVITHLDWDSQWCLLAHPFRKNVNFISLYLKLKNLQILFIYTNSWLEIKWEPNYENK